VTALSRKIGHNEQLEGFSHDGTTAGSAGPAAATDEAPEPVTVGAPADPSEGSRSEATRPEVSRPNGAVVSRSPIPEAYEAPAAPLDPADRADSVDLSDSADPDADSYGAHATTDGAIPFTELMRRLQDERQRREQREN
jgi:hypothetical protein